MVLRDLPSLVDHQQNPLGIVDHPEVLGRWGLPVVPECLLERCRQLFGALHELVDHDHVHVRRLCAEMQAQVARAFNDVDLAPDQSRGCRKLFFEIDPIVDHYDLEIRQVTRCAKHARHKNHGERLARPLGMPDHARSFLRRLPGPQPVDDPARGAVLLVAADHFHAFAGIGVHKHGAGAQNVEQRIRRQQALDQALLFALGAERRRIVAAALRPDVLPGMEMFMTRRNRAEFGLLTARSNQQQVGIEQAWFAFAQSGCLRFRASVAVSEQLHERFVNGVRRVVGVANLRLHHQGDSVDEEHDVRNNATLHAARRVDSKLIDCVENFAPRVREVDQLHDRVGLTGDLVHVHLGLEKQFLDCLVGFEQSPAGVADQLIAQVLKLALSEPWASVRGAVDCAEGIAAHYRQEPLAKAHPQAGGRVRRDDAVAHLGDLQRDRAPAPQTVSVTATSATNFTASAPTQTGGSWLSISPSGALTTNRTLTVSASLGGLAAGSYSGSIAIVANGSTRSVPVTLVVNTVSTGGGTSFKLIGWNDLGMHCDDGKDYSVFDVLPPYNTIHTHLIDSAGKLVISPAGYTVTYQAINDPLTNTLNTTSVLKTNFWQFAAALGFGALADDVGVAGFGMPGAGNTPQSMTFNAADNTWLATGVPMMNYADADAAPYPVNYFPMMRLVAGTVLATTDIVLPISDEMTCSACHASNTGTAGAQPSSGWVNNADMAKDVKLNIVRKHDDRFRTNALFQSASAARGYSASGLEAQSAIKPFLCASCHGSNALSLAGYAGVPALTTSMHGLHSTATDPATNQSLESATTRDACYHCHPGPKTQCVRGGAMGNLKTATGTNAVECQSCHGTMSTLAVATRQGWLNEPACQGCHTGTATANSGQIAYTSAFTSGTTARVAADQTFATNADTPAAGLSLYRFSKGHGGLQCEACHGSTHAEFPTTVANDNVQSTTLQGHAGTLAECASCHGTVPNAVTGALGER